MSERRSHELKSHVLQLRRYARALLGDRARGDAAVTEGLQRLLQEDGASAADTLDRAHVFRAFHHSLRVGRHADAGSTWNDGIVVRRLSTLSERRRQVLVLHALEGFSVREVAEILEMNDAEAEQELASAREDVRAQAPSRILVIEDEPVIALDISAAVSVHGHDVVGIAATHREAVELAQHGAPELVLADIQLADDSSGLDAVKEILEHFDIPVIFITAFPDRLLRGDRPEPTFIITKPFDHEILSVTIAQALSAHLANGV